MIDWNRVNDLREEVGAEDFDEVVDLFLQEVDAEIADLETTASGAPLEAKLHFLKGSALSLGFEKFSELCQSGESRLGADPTTAVDLEVILSTYRDSRTVFLADLQSKLAS